MTSITIDTSEVDAFVARLQGSGARLTPKMVPVLKRAAQNVKTATQDDLKASGNRGFRKIAGFVKYDDVVASGNELSTTVKVLKQGAGKLGNIAVYGTSRGGGTRRHPSEFALAEMPAFQNYLAQAAAEVI